MVPGDSRKMGGAVLSIVRFSLASGPRWAGPRISRRGERFDRETGAGKQRCATQLANDQGQCRTENGSNLPDRYPRQPGRLLPKCGNGHRRNAHHRFSLFIAVSAAHASALPYAQYSVPSRYPACCKGRRNFRRFYSRRYCLYAFRNTSQFAHATQGASFHLADHCCRRSSRPHSAALRSSAATTTAEQRGMDDSSDNIIVDTATRIFRDLCEPATVNDAEEGRVAEGAVGRARRVGAAPRLGSR